MFNTLAYVCLALFFILPFTGLGLMVWYPSKYAPEDNKLNVFGNLAHFLLMSFLPLWVLMWIFKCASN
jgi:hypothetical protein